MSALVNDANMLVVALTDQGLDEQAASAVALLALVAGQDVEPAGGSDGTDGRSQSPARSPKTVSSRSMTLRHGTRASHPRPGGTARGHAFG